MWEVFKVKKAFKIITVLFLLCFFLNGCSFSPFKAVDLLMRPPSFSNTDKNLINAFTLAAGESTVLCAPLNGEYNSAVVVEDIDSDGDEEALIFYKLKNGQGIVRVNILRTIDGCWRSVADFNGPGSGVDSIGFYDLDDDGSSEIFISWRVGSSAGKILSVYMRNSDNVSYREIFSEQYSLMCVGDADSDFDQEILLVGQNSMGASNHNFAKLLKLSGGKLNEIGIVSLDVNVSGFVSIKSEKVDENSPLRFYVDLLKGDQLMITDIIYWSSSKTELLIPFTDDALVSNTKTIRYEMIPSMDINNDGIIDIPVQTIIESEKNNDTNLTHYLTEWCDYSENGLETFSSSYINLSYNYIFFLNKDEIDEIKLTSNSDNCWIFNADSDNFVSVFSILFIESDNWNDEMQKRYTVLEKRDNGYICTFISPEGMERDISPEKIADRYSAFNY